MNIVDRIREIIDYKGISERKFCQEIGVSNGFLGKVSDVGSSKLKKILDKYPEINPGWLLTGDGEMLTPKRIINSSDSMAKGFIWLFISMYEKQKGINFSYNSFQGLANIFDLASTYTKALQNSLEAEIMSGSLNNAEEDTKPGVKTAVFPESPITKLIDKYVEYYKKLEIISSGLMEVMEDLIKEQKILEYVKNESLKL